MTQEGRREPKFALGATLQDTVTGVTGIATVRSEWLNGCWRYGIQQPYNAKLGKTPEADYVDEEQIKQIKRAPGGAVTGG